MANKYVDRSATFNGDGTASNQAASAGAVGAWNSLANPLNNVPGFGSIVGGDNVYIRTKNGTNLSETKTDANITTPARTAALPVNWIFDDGTVWPGDAGVFTLTTAAAGTLRTWTLGSFNNLIGAARNFRLYAPFTGWQASALIVQQCYIKDLWFETYKDASSGHVAQILAGNAGLQATTWENCLFAFGALNGALGQIAFGPDATHKLVNCDIDLTGANTTTDGQVLLTGGYGGSAVEIIGGNVLAAAPVHYLYESYSTTTPLDIKIDGMGVGLLKLDPRTAAMFAAGYENQNIDITNITNTLFGMTSNRNSGRVDWRDGENYPYGNAVQIDAENTPWSYKVFSRASVSLPFVFPVLEELFTAAAATKTITANLLINNNLASPQKDQWWMTVSYVSNVTGLRVSETTRAAGALDTATGVWNSTVYGAQNYTQYKLALTTAAAIKQHTTILVTLFTTRPAVLSTDFYFVDPEVVIV